MCRHSSGVRVSGLDEKMTAKGLSGDKVGHDLCLWTSACLKTLQSTVSLVGGLGQANGLDGRGSASWTT